jgi:hypothetical protein
VTKATLTSDGASTHHLTEAEPDLGLAVSDRDLLQAILVELRGLHGKFDALTNRDERLKPALLLAAIADAAGDRLFTTRELVHHADYAEPLRAVINGKTPKALGRIFRQIENQNFDGLCIKGLGPSRDGVLWRVCEFGANTLTE